VDSGGGSGGGDGSGGSEGTGGGAGADTCGGADPAVIDNFESCDTQICELEGRSGSWFNYADVQVNDDFDVKIPGGTWLDQGCAAVHTGGGPASGTDFAGIAVQLLNEGDGYDASGYTGIRLLIETGDSVYLHITCSDGGHYGAIVPGGTVGSDTRNVPFSSMVAANDNAGTKDLTHVTKVGIDAGDPESYGYALHRIEFY
jgi:hypothetical protein